MSWKLLDYYPRGWWPLCVSSAIAGAPTPVYALGQEFLLWRTQNGELALVEAYCPHMGAHFGTSSLVCDDKLQCGFHGIRFCVDGSSVEEGLSIQTFPVCEQDNVVYAWLGGIGQPSTPSWQLPKAEEVFGRPIEFVDDYHTLQAPWVIFVGNAIDLAHVNYVHHGNRDVDFTTWDYEIGPESHQFYFSYRTADGAVEVRHRFYGPTVAFSWITIGDHEVRHYGSSLPIDESETKLILRYDIASEPRIMEYFRKDISADFQIAETCRPQQPVYLKQDGLLKIFHGWLESLI